MGADLFEEKFDGAVWALDHLPGDPLPPPGPNRPEMDTDLCHALTALIEHGHEGPFQVLGAEKCALMVLRSDWSWLRGHAANLGLDEGDPLPHADDTEHPSPFPTGRPPAVETEAELERALTALDTQGFPERAFALCKESGRRLLAAVLSARAYDAPAAWAAENAPKKVLRGLLSEVVLAVQQVRLTGRTREPKVNSGFLPDIGRIRSGRCPRAVHGDKALTLPLSVRRVVRGEHGTRVESEVVLPRAEHSRTWEDTPEKEPQAPAAPQEEAPQPSPDGHADGPPDGSTGGTMYVPADGPPSRGGVPGQLATIRWEGFSHAWDDLGNRYLMLFEVEKGQPGLSWFLGTEVITQTLFPALAEDATQLVLTNPGHLISRAPTIDGQVSGRPSVRTVPDGNTVTVELRRG
ncbi:hypothetical protein [Nocardiopsis kunsanensis]|uniref:hypothetical protein n=1 Tax=Nocardiopsis kunsanensis TaxID=141693 RepID=UPI00034A3194|nr:hypothetical protein [Nocardiopsis kunsanensis]